MSSACSIKFSLVTELLSFPSRTARFNNKQYEELTGVSTDAGLKATYANLPVINLGWSEKRISTECKSYFHPSL